MTTAAHAQQLRKPPSGIHIPGLQSLSKTFNEAASNVYQHSAKAILFPILKHQLSTGQINHFDAALKIAKTVHGFAKRRTGHPYMSHVHEVINGPNDYVEISYSQTQRAIAAAHDVIEDAKGAWKLEDFRALGFNEEFLSGLDGVTHRKGEKYLDFIERCSLTPGAPVKCVDNLRNWSDNPKPMREKLYRVSYHYLRATMFGKIEAGSSIADFAMKEGLYDEELFGKYSSHTLAKNYSPPSHKAHMRTITPSGALGASPL